MNDAVRPEMQHREMRMSVGPVEIDRARRLCGAACEFRLLVFESVRQDDLRPMRSAGDRVADRLRRGFDNPGMENRPIRSSMSASNSMGLKSGSWNFSIIAASTLKMVANGSVSAPERIFSSASRCGGVAALVDHRQTLAVALRGWLSAMRTCRRTSEPSSACRRSDPRRSAPGGCTAVALGGKRVELAGAAPRTVAGADFRPLDAPIDMRHLSTSLTRPGLVELRNNLESGCPNNSMQKRSAARLRSALPPLGCAKSAALDSGANVLANLRIAAKGVTG